MLDKHATTCTLATSTPIVFHVTNKAGYHASSTCAMGKSDNPNAVFDSRLRVRGVRNLRDADVSSVPRVDNGHTQMVAYGIGDGAAETVRKDDAQNSFLKLTHGMESVKV
jgi:choline dehydrogenase-like flavoprotein